MNCQNCGELNIFQKCLDKQTNNVCGGASSTRLPEKPTVSFVSSLKNATVLRILELKSKKI